MFCPQCGSTQSDELKYCKSCGANLQALRQIMATRETDENIDWNKTWVAEMFMTRNEIDRAKGITPEMKRLREIKAGVITSSAGVALMILLFVLMNGIVATGRVSDAAAEILMRLWIVGVMPLLIGSALIFNGVFISKPRREISGGTGADVDTRGLADSASAGFLSPPDTNELESRVPFSVTDRTTRHLVEKKLRKE